jgi:hypothetical protein
LKFIKVLGDFVNIIPPSLTSSRNEMDDTINGFEWVAAASRASVLETFGANKNCCGFL